MQSGPRTRWLQLAPLTVCAFVAVTFTHDRPTPLRELMSAVESDGGTVIHAHLTGLPIYPTVPRAKRVLTAGDRLKTRDLHIRGIALLLSGRTSAAMPLLQKRTEQQPRDSGAWNDFAAACYEAALLHDDAAGFGTALAAVTRAIVLDPNNEAARLNRGLALAALHIQSTTPTLAQEWTNALPRLEHACLAHRSGETLSIIRRYPQNARAWAESVYPAQWAEATRSGKRDAASKALDIARCIASGLAVTSGEKLASDAIAVIDAGRNSDELAGAYLTYRNARILYAKRAVVDADPLFNRAEILFRRTQTPLSIVATYYRSNVAFDQEKDEDALDLLARVNEQAHGDYKALRAQVLWQQSTVFARDGRLYESLLAARQARDAFLALHETNNATRMQISMSSLLALLGRPTEAWRARRDAFAAASASGEPLLIQSALATAAEDELIERHWDMAAAFFNEDAQVGGSPRLRAEVLLWGQVALSRAMSERPDFRRARSVIGEIPDPILREEMFDQYRLADASTRLQSDPVGALRALDETIAFRTRRRLLLDLPEAYLTRARLRRATGATKAAADDLATAINQIESRRGSIREILLRDTYFDTAASVFDAATEIAVEQRDFRRVFELGERQRARVIVDNANGSPLTLQETQRQMPQDAVMLHFTTIENCTVALVVTHTTFRTLVIKLSRAAMVGLRAAFCSAINANDRSAQQNAGRRIFDALIAPFSDELAVHREVVIVPDDATAGIPYAALTDSAGDYLVEKTAIVLAPSATAYLAIRQYPVGSPFDGPALIVADPLLGDTFADLPPLHGARNEALEVANRHHNSRVLTGAFATRRDVLGALPGASMIHFAVHVIANPRNPIVSEIPLAPVDGHPSAITIADVAHLRLPRHPLVILAGCRSGSSNSNGAVRDFAAAFLAAGSQSVIGTLWDIADDDARLFSRALHRELTTSRATPADALRRAQLSLLHSGAALGAWSGFQYYGR